MVPDIKSTLFVTSDRELRDRLREKGADEEKIQRTLKPKYIIYDMETDTSQNIGKSEAIDEKRCIHKPMKIVAFKLEIRGAVHLMNVL